MIESTITKVYNLDKQTLWDIITNNYDFSWRSDVVKIDIIDTNHFVECTKDDIATSFIITKKEPYTIYEFELENKNLKGTWTGRFLELEKKKTEIAFTEKLEIKNPVMRITVKMTGMIKKMQLQYANDLESYVKDKYNGKYD